MYLALRSNIRTLMFAYLPVLSRKLSETLLKLAMKFAKNLTLMCTFHKLLFWAL